ncbi:hypothetical protein [Povalibacter sp.]|uniref:hypothetical protein n=1 Tax=Povalibacter sp. TaxID=1962978 RepID=UPI002F4207DC
MSMHRWHALFAACLCAVARLCAAEHDIEYVAEHLPEVAMDNRYATLPVWTGGESDEAPGLIFQGAASSMQVGTLSLDGPMLSMSWQHDFGHAWRGGVIGFYDHLTFDSGRESRPLQTLFRPDTPIERPAAALFTDLDGTTDDRGVGFFVAHDGDAHLLGRYTWVAGALWQQVVLSDYRFDYEILAGPQRGMTGSIDFDATYGHVTPFAGIEVPRDFGEWSVAFHALLAYPLPRRGVAGHICGPGFDLSGDSATAGNGTHFGDPSVTLGLNLTYRPARLTIDVGTLLSQALLEPIIHKGIEQNLVLSFTWAY